MRHIKQYLLSLSACTFINCASNPFHINPYKDIEKMAITSPTEAGNMLEAEIKANSDAPDMSHKLLLAGEYYRIDGDYKKANTYFQNVIDNYPNTVDAEPARLGKALIRFELGGADALQIIRTTPATNVPDTMNADKYRILYIGETDENSALAQTYKQKAKDYAQSHPKILEQLYADIPPDIEPTESNATKESQVVTEEKLLETIQLSLQNRQWEQTIQQTERFLEDYPNSTNTFTVQALQDRAKAQEPFVDKRVAVLLPLTGTYKPAGEAVKNAITFANEINGTAQMDIHFYDTEFNSLPPVQYANPDKPTEEELQARKQEEEQQQQLLEQQTYALIKKVVVEDGAALIIGPLLQDIALPAAKAAQAYNIPMLNISNSEDALSQGNNNFRVSMSIKQQVIPLVDHVMEEKGWKKFVAMIPDDEYGKKALEEFTMVVEERGGQVLRHVAYNPESNSFMKEARLLGEKSEESTEDKTEESTEDNATKPPAEEDLTLDHPVLDFDAVFIPDNYKRTALVVASLASEKYSIGKFRMNRHATPIGVMGLNKWNNPAIVDKGGQYMVNAIFVDAFWSQSQDEAMVNFTQKYQESFHKQPNLYDAIAYDSILISNQIFLQAQGSRDGVRNSLEQGLFTGSLTGIHQFTTTHELDRDFHILVVTSSKIEEWTPTTPPK